MHHDDIGYLLNRAARQIRLQLVEALAEVGLRPQQAAVLMAIASSTTGSMTPSAVAAAVDTDVATMSGLLERLVRDGWLNAGANPADGRSRLFSLTDKALRALPRVAVIAETVSAEATSCLSEKDIETLRVLLSRLCERDDEGRA